MFCRSLLEGLLAAWREASPWQTPCVLDFFFFASVKPPDITSTVDITGFIRMNLPCPTDQFRSVFLFFLKFSHSLNQLIQDSQPGELHGVAMALSTFSTCLVFVYMLSIFFVCDWWLHSAIFPLMLHCACIHSTGPSARPDDVCSPSEWRLCGETEVSTVSPHDLTDHFIDSARKVWRKPGG